MSTTKITMPQLGESVEEGTIAGWLVKPGDAITEFAPLLEVETDKVTVELPSPVTGVLIQILTHEGETVRVGAEIAVVEIASDEAGEKRSPEPNGRSGERVDTTPESSVPEAAARKDPGDILHSEPAPLPPAEPSPPAEQLPPDGRGTSQAARGDKTVPLTRVRMRIAENVTRSKATIPHAWQAQQVDMSGVVANRAANKDQFKMREGYSLTYLPYVIRATATALLEHPEVNATFSQSELILHGSINIGISVGLEDTLVVPVIRNADQLSIGGIARSVGALAQRAREGHLHVDDLSGGTFTVNNSGTFGTDLSYSVIVPGQAGILTMAAIVERPVVVGGAILIRPMMYLCFSLDHRVLDGLAGARFLTSCRVWLEAVTNETPL
jgi:2-oxoisovalerate dehydrogenase E2 component (dihydrolipoyl transacylase)